MRAEFYAGAHGGRWLLATAIVAALLGCGGPANEYDAVVTGTVTIDGDLAPTGTVTFHPQDKSGKIAIGRIYPDGSFSLRTGQGDLRESDGGTVVSGEYIVTVNVTGPAVENSSGAGGPPMSGPLLIDARYVSNDTSDLRYTVKPGENIVTLALDAAKPVEETAEAAAGETTSAATSAAETPADTSAAPAEESPAAEQAPAEPSAPAEPPTTSPVEGAPQ